MINQKTGNIVKLEFTDLRMYDADNDNVSKLHNELPANFLDIIRNQDQDISVIPLKTLAPIHSRNLEWEWAGNIYDREGSDAENVRWASGNSTLILINTSKNMMAVKIEGDVATTASSTATLKFKWQNSIKQIAIANVPQKISIDLNVPPGLLTVDFQSDALPLRNGDPRNIALGFFNFKIMQH